MQRVWLVAVAALLAAPWPSAHAARILGVFGHIGKSHWDVFEPLMVQLARRGHQVVVISHFPQKAPVANYTDVSLQGSFKGGTSVGFVAVDDLKLNNWIDVWHEHQLLSGWAKESCEIAFSHPKVQKLLHSEQKFDLLITEMFTSDCYLAFAHHYKVPHIAVSSCLQMPWLYLRFGSPLSTAYTPDLFHDFSTKMTFWERVQNTAYTAVDNIIYEFLYQRPTEQIAQRYFKDLPPLRDLAYNTSLMLLNTHFSMVGARPKVPAIVEVAGIHVPPLKPLPQDIKAFLDGGSEGVVYFNMGSMIRATSLPDAKRRAFLEAFRRLGRHVLWKWEEAAMPGQPPSVKTSKWLPQNDVLRHPNVRVYIGHGGMLGAIEAAYAGVPMLAIPIFGDQRANVHNMVRAGTALRLDYEHVTADSVHAALMQLLENPKYREGALRVSRAIRDRPRPPLDEAVYWTEYVLRQGGAAQVRSVELGLPWYQRWLLDVAALGLAAAAGAGIACLLALRALLGLLGRVAAAGGSAKKLKSH